MVDLITTGAVAGVAAATKAFIIDKLAKEVGDWILDAIKAGSFSESSPEIGSLFLTHCDGFIKSWNGEIISMYYHPTKAHTATTVGKLGTKQSKAAKGEWAISRQTRALTGNKAYYNHLE